MKNILLLITCGLLMTVLCSFDNERNYVSVRVEIKGLGDDTVYVSHASFDFDSMKSINETVVANNDKFQLRFPAEENQIVWFQPKKLVKYDTDYSNDARCIFLMLELGKPLDIIGKIENSDFLSYMVKQKSVSSDYANERQQIKTLLMKLDSLKILLYCHYFSPECYQSPAEKNDAIIKSLVSEMEELKQQKYEYQFSYVNKNLDKELSAFYLLMSPLDEFGKYYPQLTEVVRNGIFQKILNQKQRNYERHILTQQAKGIVQGMIASDFTLQNLEGESVSLSSLNGGKYIALVRALPIPPQAAKPPGVVRNRRHLGCIFYSFSAT